jgi:hypothetical protein
VTSYEWQITVRIDDGAAITMGRTVHPAGDAATPDECRVAFATALPQFMARAVAERYAQALASRAASRANDLASAVVSAYPPEYDPTRFVAVPTEPSEPPGPLREFREGPAADPAAEVLDLNAEAPLGGTGDLAGITDPPPIE